MIKIRNVAMLALFVATTSAPASFAEESTMEKANTEKNKAIDSTKETYRDASDKVCETVNGKVKCVGKKMKHKMQNVKDRTDTKVKEEKDKID